MASHANPTEPDYFTDTQVAALLGVHPVSVRRWRTLNKKIGLIKHGPPYEFRGARVVYPKEGFRDWCSQVRKVNGVPSINLPVSSNIPLPSEECERPTANVGEDDA